MAAASDMLSFTDCDVKLRRLGLDRCFMTGTNEWEPNMACRRQWLAAETRWRARLRPLAVRTTTSCVLVSHLVSLTTWSTGGEVPTQPWSRKLRTRVRPLTGNGWPRHTVQQKGSVAGRGSHPRIATARSNATVVLEAGRTWPEYEETTANGAVVPIALAT